MKIFNNSHSYNVNSASSGSEKKFNLRLTRKIKMVPNHSSAKLLVESRRKQTNLKELIKNSYVVADSGKNARDNFVNTRRFNGVVTSVQVHERTALLKDMANVIDGNITPLIGKGIVDGKVINDKLPVMCDYVRIDKESDCLNNNQINKVDGINSYNGNCTKSSEIIPGTPMGNYYNKQTFGSNLKVMQLDNGNCGTVGFRFDITQIKANEPLLIHGGALSGCTMVYGVKDNYFYAFHSGRPGNDTSAWQTKTDGSKTIIDSHKKLTNSGSQVEGYTDIQVLADYLSDNFDFSMMTFCGHGESINTSKNVTSFDYNSASITVGDDKARVANSMAILTNDNGKIKISLLGDDLAIDKTSLTTESKTHVIMDPVEISI